MKSSVLRFVRHVEATCREHGIRLKLNQTHHVRLDSGTLCNGYFVSGSLPTFAVAMKKPIGKWLPTFVHESCHLDQWVEQDATWIYGAQAFEELNAALDDKNPVTHSYVPVWAKLVRELELNCERRALRKIIAWKLPINPKAYARSANAYVWFYTMIPELGSWYIPGKEPYNDKRILALCPDHFVENYDVVPEALRKEYLRLMNR